MEQLTIEMVVIETTRRCNMICGHCARGKSENINMDKNIQAKFLNHISKIIQVNFTGGEPSLYPQAINDFIDICTEKNISVEEFEIATNAKNISDEFMLALIRLYMFCTDNEISIVRISNSQFHQNNKKATKKLQTLKFVDFRYKEPITNFLNEGFYKDNYNIGIKPPIKPFQITDNYVGRWFLSLNCEGFLIAGCDWSYESQRNNKDIQICHVNSENYLEEIIKYNNKLIQKGE